MPQTTLAWFGGAAGRQPCRSDSSCRCAHPGCAGVHDGTCTELCLAPSATAPELRTLRAKSENAVKSDTAQHGNRNEMATQKPGEWANSLLARFEEQVRWKKPARYHIVEQSWHTGSAPFGGLLLELACPGGTPAQDVCGRSGGREGSCQQREEKMQKNR